MSTWGRRLVLLVVGWVLVVLGIAALVLPGPGLLCLAGGLVVLSQEYEWAERRVEPVKKRAFDAARSGVKTWPRIAGSALGVLWLLAAGIIWTVNPRIPEFWIIGPRLPFAGWPTGSSLILSGLVAGGLLVYSIRRWRGADPDSERARQEDRAAADELT